jgi:hypothetical protein
MSPLVMHSKAGLVVNDRWEKAPLMTEDLEKIKLLLEKIKVLKYKGLTSFGIIVSYIRRWVQPLKVRETYGFEYSGAEDPPRLVLAEEISEDEFLQWLRKVLEGVSVVPHQVEEYNATHPPPAVSSYVLNCVVFLFSLQNVLTRVCVDAGVGAGI